MAEKKIVDLIVNDNLKQTESHLKDLNNQLKVTNNETDNLKKSFNELDKSATNLDATFEEVYGDLKPLTARMGEAEDRLYELALAGKQGTKEFNELLAVVGKYRKTQILTDLAVDSAATTMNQKLGGALQYVAGGFAATQGAMALFGKENKDVEKAILKVQSALAITQGFTAMRDGANSIKMLSASFKSLTIFQTAYNFVNNATSIGLKVLRGALIATGIGALIVGVGMLIANFDKLKAGLLKLVPSLAVFGEAIGKIYDAFTDFVGITSDATRAMDKMLANADKSLAKNAKFLDEHGTQVDEYTKRKLEAVNEYNEALKKDGANQVALKKELDRKIAKIDAERKAADDAKAKEAKDKQKELDKEAKDRLDAYNKSIVDATQAYYNEIADIEADTEQKKLDLWKKRQVEEIKLLAKNRKDRDTLLLALQADYNLKSALLDKKAREEGEAAREKYEQEIRDKKAQAFLDLQSETQGLIDESNRQIQAIADANLAKAENEELSFQERYAAVDEREKLISEMIFNSEDERTAYEKQNSETRKKIATAETETKKALQLKYAEVVGNIGALLRQAAGENKDLAIAGILLEQASAIAIIGINAQKNAAKAGYLTPLGIAELVAGGVGIASAIISAKQGIDAINASGIPGGSGGGGGGGSSPVTPRFNVVGAAPASANQIANTIGKDLPPVKAYVVANDVTSAQSLNRNIVSSASLG
jgi:hypothetical protein